MKVEQKDGNNNDNNEEKTKSNKNRTASQKAAKGPASKTEQTFSSGVAEKLINNLSHKKDELKKHLEEKEGFKEKWIRMAAENDNLRKRFMKESQDIREYSKDAIAKDMVEVDDNLKMALNSMTKEDLVNEKILKVYEGVQMISKIFDANLAKHNIYRIFPLNEKFNHNEHQAIKTIVVEDKENGVILDVVKAGYKIKNRVLSPALVVVNSKKEPVQKTEE